MGILEGLRHMHDSFQHARWPVTQLNVEIATDFDDDTPKTLNVIDTLDHQVRMTKKNVHDDRHWLPSSLNKNNETYRQQQVLPLFSRAALNAGFALRIKGWEGEHNKKKQYMVLTCERYRSHQANRKKSNPSKKKNGGFREATSSRAQGEQCSCGFIVITIFTVIQEIFLFAKACHVLALVKAPLAH